MVNLNCQVVTLMISKFMLNKSNFTSQFRFATERAHLNRKILSHIVWGIYFCGKIKIPIFELQQSLYFVLYIRYTKTFVIGRAKGFLHFLNF